MEPMDIRKASRFLSYHLDCHTYVGSKDSVNVRRLVHVIWNNLFNKRDTCHSVMRSGSKGEGLNVASSDDDFMFPHNHVIVVQPHDAIPERDASKTVLVMDTTDCKPGFTLLRLYQAGVNQNRQVMTALTEMNGYRYLSSVMFSSNMLMLVDYLDGPCSTGTDGYDVAFCFNCRSWPDHLSDFRFRTMHCSWPSKQLVNYILRNGCHVVATGDKLSSLYAMQWRISFAKAEKSLVMSFNHVQLKTYALLNIFLKECIERDESITDLLCSDVMKTIVFHAIEHSTSSKWVDENIVPCFWYCFTILMEFVQTGYCPNYFVLTHNMFRSNGTGESRKRLLHVLRRYQCMGWTCLFQCRSLRSLPQTITTSRSMYPLSKHPLSDNAELLQDAYVFSMLFSEENNIATALQFVNKVFLECSEDNQCDTALLYFIKAITKTSSNSISGSTRTHANSNKTTYRQIRKHTRLLHVSSASDVCGGLLSLATFYYNVDCYNKASADATRAVFACQQRALLQIDVDQTEYKTGMCGKGYTLLQKATRSFVLEYNIDNENNTLYPPELEMEVQNHDGTIYLPPLPYALFLLMLSNYRFGDNDQSRAILDDLLAVRTNQIYGIRRYPIVHNLIGIGHQLLGDTRQAIKSFEDSCRELPENPAASIRIADLRRPQREQGDNTDSDALDYCNVACRSQSCESIDNDDDDRLYYHKTMYNTDPVSFVNLS